MSNLPTIEAETRPFWDAVKEGRFLIRRCTACGRAHHYPRPFRASHSPWLSRSISKISR